MSQFPAKIEVQGVAQNPEGIEFDKNDGTFLLSSLNAGPIIKVEPDGTYVPFTSDEPFPMSTAGLQIDYKHERLLVAALNGEEMMDGDPTTKGTAHLRVYNLRSGIMEMDVNLSSLVPDAPSYMANDIAVDPDGNIYVTDWFAAVVYRIDGEGTPSVFWSNDLGIQSGGNGIDYHPDGYLLVSLVSVDEQGLYANFGLVRVPIEAPGSAELVGIGDGFTGFDGMVLRPDGVVVGVTNDGVAPGGNTLIELASNDGWRTAEVVNSKQITPSTTVAVTPNNQHFVINQDFGAESAASLNWTIERIEF